MYCGHRMMLTLFSCSAQFASQLYMCVCVFCCRSVCIFPHGFRGGSRPGSRWWSVFSRHDSLSTQYTAQEPQRIFPFRWRYVYLANRIPDTSSSLFHSRLYVISRLWKNARFSWLTQFCSRAKCATYFFRFHLAKILPLFNVFMFLYSSLCQLFFFLVQNWN